MMKIGTLAILSVVALLLCGCSTLPMNEIPMYGEALKSPEVQKSNQELVDEAVQYYGSREKASDAAVDQAWQYYDQKELGMAMKRFNQAWLLNTNNAQAYQGMGVVVGRRAKTEADIRQSVALLETAREKAPENGRIMIDLAFSRTILGADLNYEQKPGAKDEFSKAQALLDEAMKTESANPDLYYYWSALEFWKKNYPQAKAKLDEAVRHGYKPTPKDLKDMDRLKKWTEMNKGK